MLTVHSSRLEDWASASVIENNQGAGPIKKTWLYFKMIMNLVDLVAIAPYYMEILITEGNGFTIARVLRLIRVFRIFKIGKHTSGITLISNTLSDSAPALFLLFFFSVLGVIIFGSLVFMLEGGVYRVTEDYPGGKFFRRNALDTDWELTPFSSIPMACYWVFVTSTTVGYGDMVPTSALGKTISIITMYCGVLFLALPITVIGANFSRQYAIYISNHDEARARRMGALLAGEVGTDPDEEEEGMVTPETIEEKSISSPKYSKSNKKILPALQSESNKDKFENIQQLGDTIDKFATANGDVVGNSNGIDADINEIKQLLLELREFKTLVSEKFDKIEKKLGEKTVDSS